MTRVSVHPAGDGQPTCGRCRVWLAGSERKNVVMADEEKRCAEVYRLNDQGLCQFGKDGEVVTEMFHGDVVVVCPCKGELPWREKASCSAPQSSRPLFSV